MNFNPKHLDRSIIAIPLLEQMKPELDLIDAFNRDHPEIVKDFNTAIQLNPDYPGGLQNAFQTAESLLTNAALLARKTFDARLKGAGPKWKAIEQLRRDALEEAIGKQTIKPPEEGRQFSVANLHATVARRLWSLNSDLEKKGIAPILRILPQRFEIIIDLNLEFPGGRDLAREWVRLNLPIAKQQAGVNDVGQEIHEEKSDLTNQYLFANLEARAICRLVAMDLAQAKEKAQSSGTGTAKGSIGAHRVRAIYHIWPDFEVSTCITRSIATVKANAAQNSFSARGKDIT